MNISAIAKDKAVTLPRWLWAIVCSGLLFLGGSVWESLASHNQSVDVTLGKHGEKLNQHDERIAEIRAKLLTKEQAAELLNQQRLEIKGDISGVREDIKGLRLELRQ